MEQKEIDSVARLAVSVFNNKNRKNMKNYLFVKKKKLLADACIYVNEYALG